MENAIMYQLAIDDLRNLLKQLGRSEFRAFGYAQQLRAYRAQIHRK
jgi:signal transduction histidine kinase